MSGIQYTVRAQVVDIQRQMPNANGTFFVDTNVWYWITYPRASEGDKPPLPYQTRYYPNFIKKILDSKGKLFRSDLSLSELTSLIERTELDIFNYESNSDLGLKQFRHEHPEARNEVIDQILISWYQIISMSGPISFTLDTSFTDAALKRFETQSLDGYDLFIIESLIESGLPLNIITDDGDFCTIEEITLYTANKSVIECAREQGKLVST